MIHQKVVDDFYKVTRCCFVDASHISIRNARFLIIMALWDECLGYVLGMANLKGTLWLDTINKEPRQLFLSNG